MKSYGYIRVSTDDQQTSESAQQLAIKKAFDHMYAATYEWGGCIVDKGVSGGKPFRQRLGGCQLDSTLQAGDVAIFTKLDRGFRSTRDFLDTMEWWKGRGINVCLLDINVDTTKPIGALMATVFVAFAEFERKVIGERTKAAADQRRRDGLAVGQAPYGFRLAGDKKTKKRHYVPDPAQRAFGAQLLAWYMAGWTTTAIYLHLLRHRIQNKRGREWSEGGIIRAIKGEMRLQQEEREAGAVGTITTL